MKIAILNVYQNAVSRGVESFIEELASRLSKKFETHVFVGNVKVPKRTPLLWRIFLDSQGISIALFTIRNIKKIWKEKYDVVIPTNGGWQALIIRIITWLYGGKMVITGHSGMGWDDRVNLWCLPNMFISLSNPAKRWTKRVNPFVRVEKISNGVNLTKFKPNGKRYSINLPHPRILCVGALTKSKRIDLTIRAVARMNNGSLLVVAGGGDMKNEYNKLGTKLLGNRFKIISVPYTNMPAIYRSCDLFTIASESYYSFELVLLEAMATGLPVVANKDEIRKEIVGGAGVLVKPTNIEAYKVALETALKLKWGSKPIKQAKKFDWDIIASKYEKVITSLYK